MRVLFASCLALAACCLFFPCIAYPQLTAPPGGGNKKASVTEMIGITNVTVSYHRPRVKGRDGQIWGKLIHVGFADLGTSTSKQSPWRAGANDNTTIEFSDDVRINGNDLPAGKYGFFVAYGPDDCTLIFSKNNSSLGSFYYDPKEDALRVNVKPVALDKSVEWLTYGFSNETENSALISLSWEKLKIPFTVEVDYLTTQLASFRKELRGDKGQIWQSWNQAAQWCAQRNINLDQALQWADTATSNVLGGAHNFQAWTTRAQVLAKLGRTAEASENMKKAWPYASETEVHQYARHLIDQKQSKEALAVFQMNYDQHPGEFFTTMGLVRGYSATGDYAKALDFAQKALALADPAGKGGIEIMIQTLKTGKDIN
jgi:Protein of unknown function (DUF2911)